MSKVLSINTVLEWILILLIFSVMSAIGNWVGYQYPFEESLVGMLILCAITLIGMIIEKYVPYNIPAIIYISIIGLLLAVPWCPISGSIIYYTSKVDLVSLTTILLAYAGVAMGKDLGEFKKVGIRGIIVTFFVIIGTYLGSAIIAQGVLMYTGII
ncbi:hypothetical protein [Candidatus Methanosphaera massiliense]|uniref:hypothetical protein n=1 Tax=Methanosphaera TaxID=2316 RepID=UPI002380032A|nr:hypothetical protein [Candidatus Methanosphaera massiliense]MDD6286615.1 hypothetical protein [Methanobacteriaceae archaeon]MDE4078720.1 hypothetical protein [Candidatus Methanosphaera massiliense]MDY2744408.1 hypothetical protein [Methanosphaera sp.]